MTPLSRLSPLSHLSPQRRRVVLVLVALVAVLAVAGVAVALVGRSGSATVAGPVRQDVVGPVLLVPGYGGNRASLQPLADRLRAVGREATILTLPGDGTGDLGAQAALLQRMVRDRLQAGAPSVDLVGYSAGGVVVRLWAKEYDGTRARRIVTLGAPAHGASLAGLAGAFVPGACPVGCQELQPNSDLLDRLNAGDETPAGPAYLSLYSATDEVVTPPETSITAGATNVRLQDVCPGVRILHGALPRDPLPVGLTLEALGTGPVPTPGPGDCAASRVAGA